MFFAYRLNVTLLDRFNVFLDIDPVFRYRVYADLRAVCGERV